MDDDFFKGFGVFEDVKETLEERKEREAKEKKEKEDREKNEKEERRSNLENTKKEAIEKVNNSNDPTKTLKEIQKSYAAVGAFDANHLNRCIEAQRDYQAVLAEGIAQKKFSYDDVLDLNQSVGFEFEFVHHDRSNLRAHVDLAEFAQFSTLGGHDFAFKLESDSGNVIELVCPPLLFPREFQAKASGIQEDGQLPTNDNTPKGWREYVTELYESMKKHLKIEREGDSRNVAGLQKSLSENLGVGEGKSVGDYGGVNTKLTGGKLDKNNGDIYSQMNILMTPLELSAAIKAIESDVEIKKGSVDFTEIGAIYASLAGEREVEISELSKDMSVSKEAIEAALIFVDKTLAGSVAIASINLENDKRLLADNKHEPTKDLSSAVKELGGIWIKEPAPNTINKLVGSLDLEPDKEKAFQEKIVAYIEKKLPLVEAGLGQYLDRAIDRSKFGGDEDEIDKYKEKLEKKIVDEINEVKKVISEGKRLEVSKEQPTFDSVKSSEHGKGGYGPRPDTFPKTDSDKRVLVEFREDSVLSCALKTVRAKGSSNSHANVRK